MNAAMSRRLVLAITTVLSTTSAALLAMCVAPSSAYAQAPAGARYRDPRAPIDTRVRDLLSRD